MRVLLIWPKGYDTAYCLPLPLGYLKSNTDDRKHEIKIVDCSLDRLDANSVKLRQRIIDFNPDVVGVSVMTSVLAEALSIMRLAKDILPRVTTIVGGSHASCHPETLLVNQDVDFVFRGEAEFSFESFLDKVQEDSPDWSEIAGLCYKTRDRGNIVSDIASISELDSIKLPDYDAIALDRYIQAGYRLDAPTKRNAPILATRGCPYRCAFCSAPMVSGRKIRRHSIEYLVKWVKYLYHEKGVRWINFLDDNFTFFPDYAADFCRRIKDLNFADMGFGTCNGIRMNRGNRELWTLMKEAGWQYLIVAPESGSERILKLMRKDLDPRSVPGIVREIKETGLKVKAFFMLGYPGETIEDIERTSQLIRDAQFDFVHFSNFQPLPGTRVFDELVERGEIEGLVQVSNYSDGKRAYVPSELRNFNFSRFVLGTYAGMVLQDPGVLIYLLKHYRISFMIKKLFLNLKSMVAGQLNQSATLRQ